MLTHPEPSSVRLCCRLVTGNRGLILVSWGNYFTLLVSTKLDDVIKPHGGIPASDADLSVMVLMVIDC